MASMTVRDHALAWGEAIHSHLSDMGADADDYADYYAERWPDGDVSHPYAVAEFRRDIEAGNVTLNNPEGD